MQPVAVYPFTQTYRGAVDAETHCVHCGRLALEHQALTTGLTEHPTVGVYGIPGEVVCGTWSGERSGDAEALVLRDALDGEEVRIRAPRGD